MLAILKNNQDTTIEERSRLKSFNVILLHEIMSKILKTTNSRTFSLLSRLWNGPQTASGKTTEKKVKEILHQQFPQAKTIDVVDISGGCGAMFEIMVEAPEFKGLSMVKQHRMINEALKEEIKDMHGLRIHTSVPP
ncbi:BolA-like protein 3 [Blattella germanica]|nr:BolA-like protein 3 [Blattella germanica]